jgi:hypothetical protein
MPKSTAQEQGRSAPTWTVLFSASSQVRRQLARHSRVETQLRSAHRPTSASTFRAHSVPMTAVDRADAGTGSFITENRCAGDCQPSESNRQLSKFAAPNARGWRCRVPTRIGCTHASARRVSASCFQPSGVVGGVFQPRRRGAAISYCSSGLTVVGTGMLRAGTSRGARGAVWAKARGAAATKATASRA